MQIISCGFLDISHVGDQDHLALLLSFLGGLSHAVVEVSCDIRQKTCGSSGGT